MKTKMKGVAREGDIADLGTDREDTMNNKTPPPPDRYEEDKKTHKKRPIYDSPPKIQVQKVIKAKGIGDFLVFANGQRVLTVGSKYSAEEVIQYDREFKLDEEGNIIYHGKEPEFEDTETGRSSIDEIEVEEGSSSVFVNGRPIARLGDKLSKGKIETASEDVLTP